MKNNRNLKIRLVIVTAVVFSFLLPLPAFCGGSTPEAEMKLGTDELIICPEPRPQICTMDYKPVCGQLQDGSTKTYSNGCGACSDLEVVGYREGECAAEK